MNRAWNAYTVLTHFTVLILIAAIIDAIVHGHFVGAAALGVFAALTMLYIYKAKAHPAVLDAVLAIMMTLNAIELAWNLYNIPGPYDETAHFYTAFGVTLILGYFVSRAMHWSARRAWLYILIAASIGLSMGALWEIGEWSIDHFNLLSFKLVSGLDDTVTDMMFDTIGSLMGAVVLYTMQRQPRKPLT